MNRFYYKLEKIRSKNEIENTLNRIEDLIFNCEIKNNPLLRRLKKEDWIVNVNNKNVLRWTGKCTIDIIKASLGYRIREIKKGEK